MRKLFSWLMAGALLAGALLALLTPQAAEATHACDGTAHIMFGQSEHCGWFDNRMAFNGKEVYEGGMDDPFGTGIYVNTPSELKTVVLNGSNSGNLWYNISSDFIILTMLGHDSLGASRSDVDNSCGNGLTCAQEWANRIDSLSSLGTANGVSTGPNGRIDWHYPVTLPCGTRNTVFQDDGAITNDVMPYIMKSGSSSCSSTDIVDTITFFNKAGSIVYQLKRSCANPVGDRPGLPNDDYTVNLSASTTTPTVTAGGTGVIRAVIDNTGPAWSDPGALWITNPGNVSTPGTQTALTGGWENGHGYNAAYVPPHWWWHTDPMSPSMAASSATLTVSISPTVAVGTILTFVVTYKPSDELGATKTVIVTMRVISVRSPSFVGHNGDTHAGGGIGDGCLVSPGAVQGNPSAASYTEYIVSASAVPGISSFKSNGAPGGTGADQLKLGSSGNYATICRPNIYQAAMDYRYSGGGTGYVTKPAGTYLLDSFSSLLPGVEIVYIDGNAVLSGTIPRKLTIIVTGAVSFNGPVLLPGGNYGAHDVPSLGIASSGPINIPNGVSRVDAYLFSNDIIDTCTEGQTDTSNCYNVLTVNGFLMGRDIAFRRLGPFNGSAQNGNAKAAGEIVNLLPQIYLNPPRFFDSSVDDLLLEGQGERQPLF